MIEATEKKNLNPGEEFSPEWELLFILSYPTADDKDRLERAEKIITSNIVWEKFVALAGKHEVAPLVYRSISRSENVPDKIKKRFEDIYNLSLKHNIIKLTETERVTDILESNGVKAIQLKGAVASERIFGDVGVYVGSDIDILVSTSDIDKSIKILHSVGYKLIDADFKYYKDYYLKELYHISFSNGEHVIELHWNLFFRFFSAKPDFWWESYDLAEMGDKKIRLLSPEKELLYLAFRAFSKGFFRLKHLLLFAATFNYCQHKIDEAKLLHLIKHFKFERVFGLSCKMANRCLSAIIPEAFFVKPGLVNDVLYSYSMNLLYKGEDPSPLKKIPLAFMKDDLGGVLNVIFRRLFPSGGEIAKRYRLSPGSLQVVLYYLLNPLLLLAKHHKKM